MHGKQRQNAVIKCLICQFIRAELLFLDGLKSPNLQQPQNDLNNINLTQTTSKWPQQHQSDLKNLNNLNMTSMDLK